MRTLPASGSLRSTANDVLKLLAAYLDLEPTRLKSAMSLQRLTRFPENGSAALGWAARTFDVGEVYLHDGGKSGRRLRSAGVGLEDRRDLLGHKAQDVTTHYSAAEIGNLVAAANRIVGFRKNPRRPCYGCEQAAGSLWWKGRDSNTGKR